MEAFIARQPVFDRSRDVFGYELLFRSGPENCFCGTDPDVATNKLVGDSLSVHGFETLTSGRRAFINVTKNILLGDSLSVLPPERSIIELLETIEPTDEVIDACRTLREAGYLLALDDFIFEEKFERLLPEMDILKIDFGGTDAAQRRMFARQGQDNGYALLAEKVETYEEFDEAADLGYTYFQGYFFCRPQMISTREIPGMKLNYLRFIDRINQPDIELDELEQIIRQDVSLTYKLLKYLNSAMFSLRSEVTSIKHAMALLGIRSLKKWASFIAMANIADDKPSELLTECLYRARFCELVGQKCEGGQNRDSELFTLGMFSLLDALVDRPISELVEGIAIAEDMRDTLLGDRTQFSPLLELATALERGDWDRVTALSHWLKVPESTVAEHHQEAILWANSAGQDNSGSSSTSATRKTA
ncbi:MAG: EAL and HDOD domain-containing protein [Phycisphaerales bacterium]